jgi:spermidine synthase
MADATEAARQAVPFVRDGLVSKALYFTIQDVQSRMQLQHPDALDLRYTRTMMGFLMFMPAPNDLLMVGLGGGSLTKFCFRYLPRTRLEVVEINPRVIALRDEFQVPPDGDRLRVIEADGAVYMRETSAQHDVVMLDAFGPHGLPPAMGTQRFYDDCVDALRPGGVLVSNFHSAARDFKACADRIGRSFAGATLVVHDREAHNSIVFARKGGILAVSAAAATTRPKGLAPSAWVQLKGAFERIGTAAAAQTGEVGLRAAR